MTKTILLGIIALAVGVVGGAGLMYWSTAPKLSATASSIEALSRELAGVREQRDKLAKHAAQLEDKTSDYTAQISDLEMQLAALEEAGATSGAEPESEGELSGFDITESLLSNLFHDTEDDGGGAEGDSKKDPAAGDQRRDAQAARMRDSVQDFLAKQIAGSKDPGVQERLQSLADYTDYMLELKRRFRQAGTPEEKAAVQEEMRTAGREMKRLVNEQQRYLLESAAKKCGVPPAKQGRFVAEMRDTLQDPFFRVDKPMTKGANKGKNPNKGPRKAAKP